MEENRGIIVMVDDDITNLTLARNGLADTYSVFTAPSGKKLFELLQRIMPTLILLDIEMPVMDGYEVIKILKNTTKTAHIPVIFLTAKNDPDSEALGFDLGAVDYILKPFSQQLLIKRVGLHILLESQKQELERYTRDLEGEVRKKTRTVLELQSAILKTVAELVECRDNITGGHIERTQRYLAMLLDFMMEHNVYAEELLSWDAELFALSSQLHDVGKISIKDNILLKSGELTNDEFEEMKKHTTFGMDIIDKMKENTAESSFLNYARTLAGCHHEKWDGEGYPYGLTAAEIPLPGRMMAIVDVYDALTNDRPYKKAYTHEQSVAIIREGKGSRFDPLLVDVFLSHETEFKHASVADNCASRDHGGINHNATDTLRAALKQVTSLMDGEVQG